MQIDKENKTITLDRHDIPGSHFTKNVYDVKYENVFFGIRIFIIGLLDKGYRVVYSRKNKLVLMMYNK